MVVIGLNGSKMTAYFHPSLSHLQARGLKKRFMLNYIHRLLRWYLSKNALPYWCIFLMDLAIIFVSGFLVYWIFHKTGVTFDNRFLLLNTLAGFSLISVVGFRLFHTYSGIMRFSSFVDLLHVLYCNSLSAILAVVADNFLMEYLPAHLFVNFTTTQICLTFILATALMWGVRVIVKSINDVVFADKRAMRVLIYGAMPSGVGLAKFIRSQKPRRYLLEGFISHDKSLKHTRLLGERVYLPQDDVASVILRNHIDAILVSPMRSNEFRNSQELQDLLLGTGVKILMAQNVKEVQADDGQGDVQIKEVSVEDLLPRDEIKVDMKSVGELLTDRRVLITGAAGSIGSEMVRQIAVYKPAAMMLIDQAETPEHDIRLMMRREFPGVEAETVVTTICKRDRMERIFSEFRPDYVFHAAAYKHVPMMEDNPSEAVQNNIFGTKVIADLSVKYGVKKFVMVSTDKAVNPTNVMGCSKRICEMYVQALDRAVKMSGYGIDSLPADIVGSEKPVTQFVTTRFGNVLGSNGSVIPLFREQIKNGGPVTVTHPDIIRFFMLIPEACKLVLEAGTKGNGGEIFVFDMGKPVKIADLAQRMINLSGAHNVKIEFTGLREGEKLYEEVLNELEGTKPTFHKKIRIAEVRQQDYAQVARDIDDLIAISTRYDDMATVRKMKQIVPEYKSNNSKYEQLDDERSNM